MSKTKLTEESAARQFVSVKLQEGIDSWATNYAALRESFGEKFLIKDQNIGNIDLFLSKIALHTASLNNVFPTKQAERIRKWILKVLDNTEYSEYSRHEIESYEKIYNDSVKLGEDPVYAIATRLLYKWLWGYVSDLDFEFCGQKTGTIGPLQRLLLTMIITEGAGWKIIKDNFDLIE